eukprot:COSAG05_NODE_478_length_9434_cov_5.178897_8_plen_77_part_00
MSCRHRIRDAPLACAGMQCDGAEPLVVVLRVASSQTANASAWWPPTLPDSIETVAASYVQGANSSKVRLFNLSPGA